MTCDKCGKEIDDGDFANRVMVDRGIVEDDELPAAEITLEVFICDDCIDGFRITT